jgi:hypothetical protein
VVEGESRIVEVTSFRQPDVSGRLVLLLFPVAELEEYPRLTRNWRRRTPIHGGGSCRQKADSTRERLACCKNPSNSGGNDDCMRWNQPGKLEIGQLGGRAGSR